ncbi:MAG: hypothetical protein JWQ09_884 [Segetibacter sp.]|nr:hypothetical protein [Segetibacter sp.]
MVDWLAAYTRLYPFLDGNTGSQFIKKVQQFDPDLLDYNDYIEKRRQEEKSTTKKQYFRDILLSYPENIRLKLFEFFIGEIGQDEQDKAKEINSILAGGKVSINERVFDKQTTSKETDERGSAAPLKSLEPKDLISVADANVTLPVVVVLTAINEEYSAVRKHLSQIVEVEKNDTHYEEGIFEYGGKKIAKIIIRESGARNTIASQETERALQYFSPDALFFVGIAGSRKPRDFTIGDVIVPEKIYYYEGGKAEKDTFVSRPDTADVSFTLLEIAKTERRKSDWKTLIKGKWEGDVKADLGVIASGEQVVEHYDSGIGKILSEHFNDTSAVEMEGFGFAKAARRQGRQLSGLLVGIVRGISDIIKEPSSPESNDADRRPLKVKEMASDTAAAFAFWLIYKTFRKN